MLRTNVYIDGFNLYYGCLKDTPYRWLDLSKFAAFLLPKSHTVQHIKYYTARVLPLPHDLQARTKQDFYLRALGTIPNLSVTFGHFLSNPKMMPLLKPPATGPKLALVMRTDEKGSDVNLASHLLLDAFRKNCDVAFVISNDSDLLEPVRIARREFGLKVGLASPFKTTARVLADEVDFERRIWKRTLERSQFPDILADKVGSFHKPAGW